MLAVNRNICIQGETVGPEVNGNRLKLTEFKFYAFHAWDLETNKYLSWPDFKKVQSTYLYVVSFNTNNICFVVHRRIESSRGDYPGRTE